MGKIVRRICGLECSALTPRHIGTDVSVMEAYFTNRETGEKEKSKKRNQAGTTINVKKMKRKKPARGNLTFDRNSECIK